ncbi:MAG: penicillin-binding protein 2 [Acidobacteriota bacterium]|nr:penicillin-binding protein 2 [Bryobacteraceae bacterium CoA2 C42]MCA2962352.1 penicillin-binding protein 2 [Acidobacteriaceae bacterium]
MSQHLHDPTQNEKLDPSVLRDDTSFAAGRVAFFQYVIVAVFLFILSGFWNLQVQDNEIYTEAADRNRIKSTPMLAARGKILDREGRVIVDNHSSFSVILSRENLKEEHLPAIAAGLNLDVEDLHSRLRRWKSVPKYRAIVIKEELTPAEISFVESHNDPDTFPELELAHVQHRMYPKDNLLAHVIGYVGEVTENELDLPEFAKYNQGDVIGKAGIERQYNDVLMGTDGERQSVVDSKGNEREVIGYKDAIPGRSLQLTIDLDLQIVAEMTLEGRRGAVVALDVRTGEVLAMVSRPAYDANKFAGRIRRKDWDEIVLNPDKPMFNRAIQSNFSPGSTFKPLVALAGLESGAIDDQKTFHCSGGIPFYGRYFRCHARGGHGTVNLQRALAQSCDVYFYNAANLMGIDKIYEYGQQLGLGRETGIDLPFEGKGLLPSSQWKARTLRQKWMGGDTVNVGIGQGYVNVTPIQLAVMIGGIANGGMWMRPHLVADPNKRELHKLKLEAANVGSVVYGMYSVVNLGGTGGVARLPGIEVCGKTGTAQLYGYDVRAKGSVVAKDLRDNAWFVGFAPRTNPEIVVAALFENGEHGNLAGPMVRDVMKIYFDKKARNAPRVPTLALAPLGAKGFAVN